MKIKYFLILVLMTFAISCGKSKEEIEKENLKLKLEQEALAEKKEQERIHLEKIEVGKSKLKMELSNYLEDLKKTLGREELKLEGIKEFKFGRSSSTKQNQISEQNKKIREVRSYISRVEEEISQTNLRETFDFQDTPEGVIKYLFSSAKSRDFNKLRYLCDPYGEGNKNSRKISFVNIYPLEMQNKFVSSFENGRIMGEPKLDDEFATFEVAVGVQSDQLEQIKLVKRLDKWYISSL